MNEKNATQLVFGLTDSLIQIIGCVTLCYYSTVSMGKTLNRHDKNAHFRSFIMFVAYIHITLLTIFGVSSLVRPLPLLLLLSLGALFVTFAVVNDFFILLFTIKLHAIILCGILRLQWISKLLPFFVAFFSIPIIILSHMRLIPEILLFIFVKHLFTGICTVLCAYCDMCVSREKGRQNKMGKLSEMSNGRW